ncbi:hypothetical protein GQ55_9G449100 [Panicum hallii var. hallii]|uniref:Jacalin-type lectin domain-containing protein n=2 Tax=Panicum hallii TaxID=206008 RepID=A0A2T7CBP4_9POAL|nr:protein GOS9-like [Panicum hallii]PAN49257.1 hypothetical protein PAHAL_9G437100 [Panicum hallii]PUZ40759.1 hypothetical protein GQ55_9G449100 [Panicum hallii var. hallii]
MWEHVEGACPPITTTLLLQPYRRGHPSPSILHWCLVQLCCGRRARVHEMSSSVVKVGTWGGDGGSPCDITVAPQRLESVTIRWGKVIDWIAFSYRDSDGKTHTAGPWGGNGRGEGTETITFGPSEYVTEVAWSVGPFKLKNVERCITSIKLVTNVGTYGPFGHAVDSTHHSLPVLGNGSVVGMFARAGDYLDAIGFYVLPC